MSNPDPIDQASDEEQRDRDRCIAAARMNSCATWGGGWFVGATIDRIDSNSHYNKENCRWLVGAENARLASIARGKKNAAIRNGRSE